MRYMAIDYGDKRTGIALTDPLGITVYGLETIETNGSDKLLLKRLEEIVSEYSVDIIVLGMPYNENGTRGERVIKTEKLMHKLKCKFNEQDIHSEDERYTSLWADEVMHEISMNKNKRKKVRDQLAATEILRSFKDKYENDAEFKSEKTNKKNEIKNIEKIDKKDTEE